MPTPELALQDEHSLVFWPRHEIASLNPERQRWRVVHRSGEIAYCPREGNPPDGPWQSLGSLWVNSRWLNPPNDPAHFPLPAGPLPDCGTHQEEDFPDLPCPAHQILALSGKDGQACWHTDLGDFPAGDFAAQAAQKHPHLVPAGRGDYVNRRRLRRIYNERKRFRIVLDDGREFSISYGPHKALAAALGLPQLYELEPAHSGFYREALRAYPYVLRHAKAEQLKADFPSARRLIANYLYQTVLKGPSPTPNNEEFDYRGYYYPLKPVLYRAGFLTLRQMQRLNDKTLFSLYLEVAATLIGEDRLFTYRDLGFEDPRPDLRHLGSTRPGVLLVAEKAGLKRYIAQACQRFGISSLVLGGLPSLLSSEFCADALKDAGLHEIDVIAFVDYDTYGYIAAKGLVKQLARYEVKTRSLSFVLRVQDFSQQEIEDSALPLPSGSPQVEGKNDAWIAETGGVNGLALGITASALKPIERFLERIRLLLEELPAGPLA